MDGVRALAILAVFFHHALHIKLLWMGVDLFFILSGFLITNVLLEAKRHSLGGYFPGFYARRARRILAPYLLTLFIASFFFGTAWLHHWYFYVFLTNFLDTLHTPRPVAFEPLWSLAVEEQFYLVWPLAVYFLDERRLRHLAITLVILAPLLRATFHFSQSWPIYALTPFRMDLLAAGALLCLVWRNHPESIRRRGAALGSFVILLGLAGLAILGHSGFTTYGNTRIGNTFIYEGSLFACFGFMLYALSGRGVGWLQTAPLRDIGRISYTMYLVHLGIIVLLTPYLHGLLLVLAALSLTVLYASISWFVLERRLLQHKPRVRAPLEAVAVHETD
ncbi:MAG: acyltransferase family protein [Acidobacteriota bacterium]